MCWSFINARKCRYSQYTGSIHGWESTDKKLKCFTHLHSNKLACLKPNPQQSAIGGKTNKSEIRGRGSSFVKKQRGQAKGLDPAEFGMNTEESGKEWKMDFKNGHKKQRSKRVKNLKSNSTQGLPVRGLSTGMWLIILGTRSVKIKNK